MPRMPSNDEFYANQRNYYEHMPGGIPESLPPGGLYPGASGMMLPPRQYSGSIVPGLHHPANSAGNPMGTPGHLPGTLPPYGGAPYHQDFTPGFY